MNMKKVIALFDVHFGHNGLVVLDCCYSVALI